MTHPAIVPTPQPIPEETWRRFHGNQRFRDRRFVESGKERQRLIDLGFIKPVQLTPVAPKKED